MKQHWEIKLNIWLPMEHAIWVFWDSATVLLSSGISGNCIFILANHTAGRVGGGCCLGSVLACTVQEVLAAPAGEYNSPSHPPF
jgi:hypothetical protein